jgi:tetratricopeptide (TPR) repeat protein
MEELIAIPMLDRNVLADAKIKLGDFYLMSGEIWEASLLYSQVDKDMKDAPLGEMARYKNAKLSYYKGDFEWAQDQLDVLKGSTSELISNDAIDVSVFIMEHLNLDTGTTSMRYYAEADLLLFQNRFDEAFEKMDSLLVKFPTHGLGDDVYMAKAKIFIKKRQFDKALELLVKITSEYKDGILTDNALFKMAEIHEIELKDKTKAMELYEKILMDFSGSTFTVEARKRFRKLRGDGV